MRRERGSGDMLCHGSCWLDVFLTEVFKEKDMPSFSLLLISKESRPWGFQCHRASVEKWGWDFSGKMDWGQTATAWVSELSSFALFNYRHCKDISTLWKEKRAYILGLFLEPKSDNCNCPSHIMLAKWSDRGHTCYLKLLCACYSSCEKIINDCIIS